MKKTLILLTILMFFPASGLIAAPIIDCGKTDNDNPSADKTPMICFYDNLKNNCQSAKFSFQEKGNEFNLDSQINKNKCELRLTMTGKKTGNLTCQYDLNNLPIDTSSKNDATTTDEEKIFMASLLPTSMVYLSSDSKDCSGTLMAANLEKDKRNKKYEDSTWTWQQPYYQMDTDIIDIAKDKNDDIYLLNQNQKNNRKLSISQYKNDKLIKEITIPADGQDKTSIYIDTKGNIWLFDSSSFNKSNINLYIYEQANKKWKAYKDEQKIFGAIDSITENKDGIWLATDKAIIFYNFKSWKIFNPKDFITNKFDLTTETRFKSIWANDKYVVFSGGFKAFIYYNKKFTSFSQDPFAGKLFLDKQNNVWEYEESFDSTGVYKIALAANPSYKKTFYELNKKSVDYVTQDNKNNIWTIASNSSASADLLKTDFQGLNKFDGKKWTAYEQKFEGIDYSSVHKMFFTKTDQLYILFLNNHGLYRVTFKK